MSFWRQTIPVIWQKGSIIMVAERVYQRGSMKTQASKRWPEVEYWEWSQKAR